MDFESGIVIQGSGGSIGVVLTSRRIDTTVPLAGGGDLTADRTISIPRATAAVDGYLDHDDFSTFAAKQAALGYTPEDVANKGAVSGYTPLDASQLVPVANLPIATNLVAGAVASMSTGTSSVAVSTDDARNTNARTPTAHTHPESDVVDLVTDLAAKEDTANKNVANGYAPLGADIKVPVANSRFEPNAFLPTDLPNLGLWLRADLGITMDGSNRVSQWNDQGPLANHWTQVTDAIKPVYVASHLNSLPGLTFNGSQWLKCETMDTIFGGSGYPFTFFCVGKLDNWSLTGRFFNAYLLVSGYNCQLTPMDKVSSGMRGYQYVWPGSTYSSGHYDLPQPTVGRAHVIHCAVSTDNGLFVTLREAGRKYLEKIPFGEAGRSAAMKYGCIGGQNSGATGYNTVASLITGAITEIIIFKEALTESMIQVIEAYLARRYALTGLLSNEYDFKVSRRKITSGIGSSTTQTPLDNEMRVTGSNVSVTAMRVDGYTSNKNNHQLTVVRDRTGVDVTSVLPSSGNTINGAGPGSPIILNDRYQSVTIQFDDTSQGVIIGSSPENVNTIGRMVNAATEKTTPIDADMVGLMDSAATNIWKKLSWANIKATLKTYFDPIYPAETTTTIGALINGAGEKTTPIDTDMFPLMDSADGNLLKKFTWANLKAKLVPYLDTIYATLTGTRLKLTAAITYYVRTDGNDSNTGLTDSAGGAFLTMQKAVDTAAGWDLNGYNVTIYVRDGTYTGSITAKAAVGDGSIYIIGNTGTPANVVWSPTTGPAFMAPNPCATPYYLSGMKTTTDSHHFNITAAIDVYISAWDFGAGNTTPIGYAHVFCERGKVGITAPYTISGSCAAHLSAVRFGYIYNVGGINLITLTGTPNFANAFVRATVGLSLVEYKASFTGAATGVRYDVQRNGVIVSGGGATYYPGDTAGTAATGGQYV